MSVEGIKTNKFRPLELNERNVKILFKKCLPNGDNPAEEVCLARVLKSEYCGKESEIIRLSKNNLLERKSMIQYLFGQIKAFHRDSSAFALQEGFLRYDGTAWTKDYDTLFKLYCMGLATASISDFAANKDIIGSIKSPDCIPTLSPKDSEFSEWYEGYKNTHPEFE
ncbi:MAG: hypothetical protein IJA51_01765 [Oscillospiraceae bacterium]|nr:hypothetical protein [Oscillospiraceae bacterium]